MDKMKLNGKICVVSFFSKEGYEVRALSVDLGYAVKMLNFKQQEIAECLDMTVRQFVEATPCVAGQKTRYYCE